MLIITIAIISAIFLFFRAIMEKYNLKEHEINCIIMYLGCGNKTYSWKQTIGIQSTSKNQTVLAQQWFQNTNVERCVYDYTKKDTGKDTCTFDTYKEGKEQPNKKQSNPDSEITSDNIKSLLETEFQRTNDPEKRTALLIKIADFLSLNKNNDEDFQTPLIYLPARCKDCTFHK